MPGSVSYGCAVIRSAALALLRGSRAAVSIDEGVGARVSATA
jgi:hypothetical protein